MSIILLIAIATVLVFLVIGFIAIFHQSKAKEIRYTYYWRPSDGQWLIGENAAGEFDIMTKTGNLWQKVATRLTEKEAKAYIFDQPGQKQ